MTLPPLKRVGFLDLRMTLKLPILAAMLKPFNRAIAPIDEPNLVSPRESFSSSVLGDDPSVWACPALRFLSAKYSVLWGWEGIVLIPSCFKSFRRSLSNALRIAQTVLTRVTRSSRVVDLGNRCLQKSQQHDKTQRLGVHIEFFPDTLLHPLG